MSETRPHLELVTDATEAPAAPAAESEGRRGGSWLSWALAGALLVCAGGWTLSSQRADELETTLRATTAALLEARGQLDAYDGHLVDVKAQATQVSEHATSVSEQVTALQGQVEALSGLLETGPLGAESAPEAAAE